MQRRMGRHSTRGCGLCRRAGVGSTASSARRTDIQVWEHPINIVRPHVFSSHHVSPNTDLIKRRCVQGCMPAGKQCFCLKPRLHHFALQAGTRRQTWYPAPLHRRLPARTCLTGRGPSPSSRSRRRCPMAEGTAGRFGSCPLPPLYLASHSVTSCWLDVTQPLGALLPQSVFWVLLSCCPSTLGLLDLKQQSHQLCQPPHSFCCCRRGQHMVLSPEDGMASESSASC